MANLFETVKSFFGRDHWACQTVEGHADMLQLNHLSHNNAWTCYAHMLEDDQEFVFYSVAPMQVTVKKRWLALEYITRANYNLPMGAFEMELDELMIRFKTSIDVENDRLSQALFRGVVYSNLAVMERYLPGLQAVVFEEVSPRDAIAAIENEP